MCIRDSSRGMYYYLLYFVLFSLDLSIKDIEEIILIAALLYCLAYLANLLLPDLFFSQVLYDPNRFLTRVYLPGSLINNLAYFYSLFMLVEYKSLRYAFFIILSFTIMVLTGSRMAFMPVMLITAFILLQGLKFRRMLQAGVVVAALFVVVLSFSRSFDAMLNLAAGDLFQQGQGGGTLRIRIQAITFFSQFFFPDYWHLLIGNGFASTHSSFGQLVDYLKLGLGFYQSDVGVFGDTTKMGLAFLFGVFILLKNVFMTKLPPRGLYLKYFFYYVVLTYVTLDHFGDKGGAVTLSLSFYLIERYNSSLPSSLATDES